MNKFFKISDDDLATIRKLNMRSWYVWAATWFGAGFMRPAPGTWGSLAALPFGLLIIAFGDVVTLIAATIIVTLIGYYASKRFEKDSGVHDSKMIVIDEVVGQWLTLIPVIIMVDFAAPFFPFYIVLAFILFRLFDIKKPWPVSYFDKQVGGPIGVMGDDIVAGIYAALILTGCIYYAGSG